MDPSRSDERDAFHLVLQQVIASMMPYIAHKPTCMSLCSWDVLCSCGADVAAKRALGSRFAKSKEEVTQ